MPRVLLFRGVLDSMFTSLFLNGGTKASQVVSWWSFSVRPSFIITMQSWVLSCLIRLQFGKKPCSSSLYSSISPFLWRWRTVLSCLTRPMHMCSRSLAVCWHCYRFDFITVLNILLSLNLFAVRLAVLFCLILALAARKSETAETWTQTCFYRSFCLS